MSTSFSSSPLDFKLASPLSVSPWKVFDNAWTSVTGYPAEDFRFIPGKTLMSTFNETALVLIAYYTIIIGGRELMRDRPAFKLNGLFLVHNFYLTAISGALLALFVQQLVPTLWNQGLYDSICGGGGWTNQLNTLYYLNYLTKYLELLDTVFLFLKKKPLSELALIVHVVMYWYYFQSARGIKIWWKEWITRLQISQFVIDLGFVYFASYNYFASAHFPSLPHKGTCAGEEAAAISGCVILSSYLVLFILFYFATYKRTGKPLQKLSTKRVAVDMKNTELPMVSETSEKAIEVLKAANHSLVGN
ncbi:hypothetical protein MMC14_001069 [Varicellaria rhodocarpa]|nr:hypothetical protein [Varicellaria rhodocarpa]